MRSLFWGLLGKRETLLTDDKEKLLGSTLMHQLISSELIALEAQLEEIEKQRAQLANASEELAAAHREKEAWLSQHGGPAGEHLFKLSEEAGRHQALLSEIGEAQAHGDVTLMLLDEVLALLNSASNWGTVDMLGGGLWATMAKHGKIDAAKRKQAEAQDSLLAFARELKDVELQLDVAAGEIDDFSKFGDYFFDGLIFDWAVQAKIGRAQDTVTKTRDDVASALDTLASQAATLATRLNEVAAARTRYIEDWGRVDSLPPA